MSRPPKTAAGVFGDRLPLAERYAELLATEGVLRGLIGPREAPRLWDRHLINCALMAPAIPRGATVADIGSGAGLPGIVLAIARPDISITLIEPLLRRTTFLDEVVAELGLDNVTVVRGRADALHGQARFDVVTSRAVAPLERLLGWSMPLVAATGELVAMKGSSVGDEIAEAAPTLAKLGCAAPEVQEFGSSGAILSEVGIVDYNADRSESLSQNRFQADSGRLGAVDGDVDPLPASVAQREPNLDDGAPADDGATDVEEIGTIHVVRVRWADPSRVSLRPRSGQDARKKKPKKKASKKSHQRDKDGGTSSTGSSKRDAPKGAAQGGTAGTDGKRGGARRSPGGSAGRPGGGGSASPGARTGQKPSGKASSRRKKP
ncbi:16S rRNA (guanine(527)-N(7))-methyltransferase RsmG [Nocardioides sp. zg-536]|uniref:Ribosomal RNA small subunit methyltransferase G n=1 Tax=Nocardioides faecalis TaxID=2803858 RepID=A0A939BYH4_9ACTN|nr:16S rRNA (guanine(527)-N(7))-methyltransferase RsmG [Nocardioides faecalis]MBM9459940.1 16S rRNA (guanine(527)-N(7))-methyltransferase RsmG [Nocardioides faecalis]QVI58834.1 16S rRNA (guanine(527)-N(7))-methyltransferase RsmG [Nocardioides faecalis]